MGLAHESRPVGALLQEALAKDAAPGGLRLDFVELETLDGPQRPLGSLHLSSSTVAGVRPKRKVIRRGPVDRPSSAVTVHDALGLPTTCLNFDLSNACLGFVNAMHRAGVLIDSGQIDYALVVGMRYLF